MPNDLVNRPAPDEWEQCLDGFVDDAQRGWRADVQGAFRAALIAMLHEVVAAVNAATRRGERVTVVLVSRRMSCLYEMFVDKGFGALSEVTVISDRALDGGVDLEKAQRVVLVDDVVNLGSTLVDLYDDIVNKIGGELHRDSVEVHVACIDADRSSPAFRERLGIPDRDAGSAVWLDEKAIQVVATSIARTMYRLGRPYFTDFPLLVALPLGVNQAERLLGSPRWYTADVTPPEGFGGRGRPAFSMVPRPNTDESIRARMVPEVVRFVEGMKVRFYLGPERPSGRMVRVVPMGLPGPMLTGEVTAALEAVERRLGSKALDWRSWSPTAQHRLLQMYASACVLAELWIDLDETGTIADLTAEVLDTVHLETYFGRDDARLIEDAFDLTVASNPRSADEFAPSRSAPLAPDSGMVPSQQFVVRNIGMQSALMMEAAADLGETLEVSGGAHPPEPPEQGQLTKVDHLWVYRVLNVFGEIDAKLERPQERILRELSYDDYVAYRHEDLRREPDPDEPSSGLTPRVIRRGVSLGELSSITLPTGSSRDLWTRALVSFAVDVGNDLGIIVPSTVERDGLVWRLYRSGETAFAADRPHQQLVVDGWDQVDLFTELVLAALGAHGLDRDAATAALHRDAAHLASSANVLLPVKRAFIGEITHVDPEHRTFLAQVTDAFTDGGIDVMEFSIDRLQGGDRNVELGKGILYRQFATFTNGELDDDVRLEPVLGA